MHVCCNLDMIVTEEMYLDAPECDPKLPHSPWADSNCSSSSEEMKGCGGGGQGEERGWEREGRAKREDMSEPLHTVAVPKLNAEKNLVEE